MATAIREWCRLEPGSTAEILLVRKDDLDEFNGYLAERLIPTPQRLFSLVPAAYQISDIVSHFLKYTFALECEVESSSPDIAAFFASWEQVCRTEHRDASRQIKNLALDLPPRLVEAAPSCVQMLELIDWSLDSFRTRLVSIDSVFGNCPLEKSKARWWKRPASSLDEVKRRTARYTHARTLSQALNLHLEWLDGAVAELQKMSTSGLPDCLVAASAYCVAAAQIAAERFESTDVSMISMSSDVRLPSGFIRLQVLPPFIQCW